jgi:hypothetical protein
MSQDYLNFQDIIKETRDFNNDICKVRGVKNKEKYIQGLCSEIESFINMLSDWRINQWYLFGLIFEGLFKIILLQEKFDEFLIYYNDRQKPMNKFENQKHTVLQLLKGKDLTNEQIQRIKDVIELVQVQRNNFLHFPLKWFSYSPAYPEIYCVMKKLIEIFNLDFSVEVTQQLQNKINYHKEFVTGRKFKDVGLYE